MEDRKVRTVTGKFGKGNPGKPVGAVNKATKNAKEAIARFVDGNAERLQGWLDEIAAKEGAKAAFICFTDLLEYHVPKLSRTEHAGDQNNPILVQEVRHTIVGE
jgi:hypothetical protein